MNTNIFVFGQLTDIIGSDNIVVPGAADTDSLINELKKSYPALSDMKFMIAVDKQLIKGNTALTGNSSIALMPPFSGG